MRAAAVSSQDDAGRDARLVMEANYCAAPNAPNASKLGARRSATRASGQTSGGRPVSRLLGAETEPGRHAGGEPAGHGDDHQCGEND
jgi:hypothetical protein